jgi:hypothetical protein
MSSAGRDAGAGCVVARGRSVEGAKDPAFAEKVADIVVLYLDPPGGVVVLSMDEKTQIQALDRTQPMLPIEFDATEKRTSTSLHPGRLVLA